MITFPATPEAFNAYQEQLIGRKQSEKEKEVGAAWVEVFNLSYEDGLTQDRDTLEKDLDTPRLAGSGWLKPGGREQKRRPHSMTKEECCQRAEKARQT